MKRICRDCGKEWECNGERVNCERKVKIDACACRECLGLGDLECFPEEAVWRIA